MSVDRQPDDMGEQRTASDRGKRFTPWPAREARFDPKVRALIKGVIASGEVALLYGPSGAGKSFVAMAICFAIAEGVESLAGRRVRQGSVVYVAFEGGAGLRNRVVAARETFGDPRDSLVIVDARATLGKGTDGDMDLAELIGLIRDLREPPQLIVLDTVSCAMAGDDENAAGDVAAFMRRLATLAAETGAAVLAIHHAGEDASKGARGNSAFRANSDVVIEITADGVIKLEKVRDGTTGEWATFTLVPVHLGRDDDGDMVTSCIARFSASNSTTSRKKVKDLPPVAKRAYEHLVSMYTVGLTVEVSPGAIGLNDGDDRPVLVIRRDQWRARCETLGISPSPEAFRSNFKRASEKLVEEGRMNFHGEWVWLVGRVPPPRPSSHNRHQSKPQQDDCSVDSSPNDEANHKSGEV